MEGSNNRSSYDLEKRRALSRWGARVESIVQGAPRLELRLEGTRGETLEESMDATVTMIGQEVLGPNLDMPPSEWLVKRLRKQAIEEFGLTPEQGGADRRTASAARRPVLT